MFRSFLHHAPRLACTGWGAIGLVAVLAHVEAAQRDENGARELDAVDPRLIQDDQLCSERGGQSYGLAWAAQGSSFFDDFDFLDQDLNNGAAQYVSADEAFKENVVEAHDTHAILRVGLKGWLYKRRSAKIATKKSWKYYLAAMRYSHLPFGCSVWPSFWSTAVGYEWPEGGELDILEWVNSEQGFSSFHTSENSKCELQWDAVNLPGCPQFDADQGLDCVTHYPDRKGCATNRGAKRSGQEWGENPGVVAVEWTSAFMKVFYIPEAELPGDLWGDAPRPDEWDRWLISYYPFAASERRSPGSCPQEGGPAAAQQLILNIAMCGDWASKIWNGCSDAPDPPGCKPVDPLVDAYNPEQDCCTQFIWSSENDGYLRRNAYFNISWLKVYQPGAPKATSDSTRRNLATSVPDPSKSTTAGLSTASANAKANTTTKPNSSIDADPEYDCELGEGNSTLSWSAAQRTRCCVTHSTGCAKGTAAAGSRAGGANSSDALVEALSTVEDPAPQALFAEGGPALWGFARAPLPFVVAGATGLTALAALLASARRRRRSQGDEARYMLADLAGPARQLQEEQGCGQL